MIIISFKVMKYYICLACQLKINIAALVSRTLYLLVIGSWSLTLTSYSKYNPLHIRRCLISFSEISFIFHDHDKIFFKIFLWHNFFTISNFFKRFFNKLLNFICALICLHWFAKSFVNAYNLVIITESNMLSLFISVRFISIIYITF